MRNSLLCCFVRGFGLSAALGIASSAQGVFLDGNGHYSLLGQTRTNPAFDKGSGLHQAIDQNFLFNAEVRANDAMSFWAQFRLFEDPRRAYLGDTAEPEYCAVKDEASSTAAGESIYSNRGSSSDCRGRHQNSGEPRYKPYVPKVTQAYARYAFDYCILEAGRRGRDWGLGIFLDSGKRLFDTDASVFDGATCHINIQKSQTLALAFGFDKLAETGAPIEEGTTEGGPFGATKPSDDLDQYFFTIEYDDRKANAGASFSQQVGIYFANVVGSGDQRTDIKFADLYLSFFLENLVIKNEFLFRLGKSADPSWARMGGLRSKEGEINTNKLQAIASAGSLDYTLFRSGGMTGPAEFNQGDAQRHLLFTEYAFAPGDRDGYLIDGNEAGARDNNVSAVAFHRNFKPALIFFNERAESDNLRVDGVFDPSRVMNAVVVGLGYRYESQQNGNFESKLISAQLDRSMAGNLRSLSDDDVRPIGYSSKLLGYELDLKYNKLLGKDTELGVAGALAFPGMAWKQYAKHNPTASYLLQTYAAFKF